MPDREAVLGCVRGLDLDELRGIVEDAFCTAAPKRLVEQLGSD
jgi:hypothetical protein